MATTELFNIIELFNVTESNHSIWNSSYNLSLSKNGSSRPGCPGTVHDIQLEKEYRLLILILTIALCITGSILVIAWMIWDKRLLSRAHHVTRVNTFILNLTSADILVILLAVTPQLVWEYVDREWVAGDFMCRAVKFLQVFSMTSSNYMLVVIAIDRHHAVRSPLKASWPVWKMAGAGWVMAAVMSLPVLGIFHTSTSSSGKTMCENIFRHKPKWHRQLWVTWASVAVFVIPCIILIVCYTRIFLKISEKVFQSSSLKYKPPDGQVRLQSTQTSSLPKAKVKTLKMTFVIVLTFILFSIPYFVVDLILSFGDHCLISKRLYAILGGMAACNSATNPYVFLAFNVKFSWIRNRLGCCGKSLDSSLRRVSYQSTLRHSGQTSPGPQPQHSPFHRQETVSSYVEVKDTRA